IIPKKNRNEICKYLFKEGVLYAKKDYNLAKHPQIDYLTNDGIEHLRNYLNLRSEIVPATLKKSAKPPGRPFGSSPPGDRPSSPPGFVLLQVYCLHSLHGLNYPIFCNLVIFSKKKNHVSADFEQVFRIHD
ncbi:hypothetical protein ACJX0J_007329, partial [Zea mays]